MKVWMITGANRGFGRAFAETAVRHGDKVIAGMRKIDESDEFYQNEHVFAVRCDVTDRAQIEAAVKAGIERFGRIDVLVNNAGFGLNGSFEETTEEELKDLFETDYYGIVRMTQAVLPYMRAQKSGTILNVSSQAGIIGQAGVSPYNAVKFAVFGMSEALSDELKPFGIRVSVLCPGPYKTDFRDSSSAKRPAKLMPEYDGTPAHNLLTFLDENNHKQAGDPMKGAEFIYEMVEKPELPVHIMMGRTCCDSAIEKFKGMAEEVREYYIDSIMTDFS